VSLVDVAVFLSVVAASLLSTGNSCATVMGQQQLVMTANSGHSCRLSCIVFFMNTALHKSCRSTLRLTGSVAIYKTQGIASFSPPDTTAERNSLNQLERWETFLWLYIVLAATSEKGCHDTFAVISYSEWDGKDIITSVEFCIDLLVLFLMLLFF
jgi:hypothetical protein